MVVVVDVATVVVAACVVGGGASVVAGSLAVVVVDIGAYVDVDDTPSPDAELHPAAVTASTATNRSGRTVCIGARCYVGWRVKRFHEGNQPNNLNLVLGFLWGSRGL
jgi:hypothetical protein